MFLPVDKLMTKIEPKDDVYRRDPTSSLWVDSWNETPLKEGMFLNGYVS